MRTVTASVFFCFLFFCCKQNVQVDDFPVEVQNPLVDGDPLIISWNLSGADSLKLDNDLFLKSDTAYYYVVGSDAIRIRVYKQKDIIYEKYIRYQLQDGDRLADVNTLKDKEAVSIPLNFLGISFPLHEAVSLTGTKEKPNLILIALLKNLYQQSKLIPITVLNASGFQNSGNAFQALNAFASKLLSDGYQVQYAIELHPSQQKELLESLKLNLDDRFVQSFVIDWNKCSDETKTMIKEMNKEVIANKEAAVTSSQHKKYDVDLSKWIDCSERDTAMYMSNGFFAKTINTIPFTGQRKSIINLTMPSCAKMPNGFESSLWLLDYLLANAEAGVSQVNINISNWTNTGNRNYGSPLLFDVPAENILEIKEAQKENLPKEYLLRSVQSPYYAMWMLSDLISEDSKIQPVKVDSANSNIKAYHILTKSKKDKFVLINKELSRSGRVFIKDTSIHRAWTTRLIATQYSGNTGVRYGGRHFDGSTNGMYSGTYYTDKVDAKITGNRIAMPAVSAAIVQSKH